VPCAIYREHAPRNFPRAALYDALWENIAPHHPGLRQHKTINTPEFRCDSVAIHSCLLKLTLYPQLELCSPLQSLTTFLLLVVSVPENPIVFRKAPVSLPFRVARQLNITGAHDVVQKDQARATNPAQLSAPT
jgi:hypothetical protein